MDAPGRSCSSETAADSQPTDENLNLHGPPQAVPFVSPMPKYRPDTKPDPAVPVSVTESPEERGKRKDSPQAFTAAPALPTPPQDWKGHKTRQRRQRSTKKPRRRHKSRRCNEPLDRKRVKRSFGCSDTIEESSSDDSVFRKKNTRHQATLLPFIGRPHQRCAQKM